MYELLIRILFFGMFGMSLEVLFVAFRKYIKENDRAMIGHVSIFMFPIYGLGLTLGFDLIELLIPFTIIRWMTYPLWIWAIEIIIGHNALKKDIRIWDYRYLPKKMHWNGIISFAHIPIWILFGIIVEAARNNLIN
jgi:hypothetical protein